MYVFCFLGVAVSASVFTMTVMSLDRYLVICHPIAFRKHLYRRHVAWSILVVWLLALLLFVPVLVVRKARGIILHAGTRYGISQTMKFYIQVGATFFSRLIPIIKQKAAQSKIHTRSSELLILNVYG